MNRRAFIRLLGGAAAWPLSVRAQPRTVPVIGFLGAATPSTWAPWVEAFEQRLRELGWTEGRTVAIEYRWAEGRPERYAEIAAEFVQRKVTAIVTVASAVRALKEATTEIPIVFALGSDPLGAGLVASLSRPGGNVTGLSNQQSDLAGKRIELLREVFPNLRRLAVIANADHQESVLEMEEVVAAARGFGVEIAKLEIRRAQDIAPAFERLNRQAGALYVVVSALTAANRARIMTFALSARLPTILSNREYAEAGALLSYGPHYPHLWRRAAEYIDRILRGGKPAEMPVEQPTKFELVINLTTARALEINLPAPLLARADEVIE
jgi:putative ABC transport system substrate-binding protein